MHVSPCCYLTQPVGGPAPPQGGASGSLVQAGFRTSQSADLQIVTADGDRVTLSSDRSTSVGYAGFSATSGGTRVDAQAVQVSSESSVSLSVEGSLDAHELADIKKVVKLLERAASSADATKLLRKLSRSHLDSLASVEGSVERTTEYSVVQATAAMPAAAAPPAAEDPAPQPPASDAQPSPAPPPAPGQHSGDFLFAILASLLSSPQSPKTA